MEYKTMCVYVGTTCNNPCCLSNRPEIWISRLHYRLCKLVFSGLKGMLKAMQKSTAMQRVSTARSLCVNKTKILHTIKAHRAWTVLKFLNWTLWQSKIYNKRYNVSSVLNTVIRLKNYDIDHLKIFAYISSGLLGRLQKFKLVFEVANCQISLILAYFQHPKWHKCDML